MVLGVDEGSKRCHVSEIETDMLLLDRFSYWSLCTVRASTFLYQVLKCEHGGARWKQMTWGGFTKSDALAVLDNVWAIYMGLLFRWTR